MLLKKTLENTRKLGFTLAERPIPWGNGCGHDPLHPDFDLKLPPLPNLPKFNQACLDKVKAYYYNDKLLPSIKVARFSSRKHRSDGQEGFIRLLEALLCRMDNMTLRVGKPDENGDFEPYNIYEISYAANLTIDRTYRQLQLAKRAGILDVKRRAELKTDGSYRGLPAIIIFKKAFFQAIGLGIKLARMQKALYKYLARKKDRLSAGAANAKMSLAAILGPKKAKTIKPDIPDQQTWLKERYHYYKTASPPSWSDDDILKIAQKEYNARFKQ